MIRITNSIFLFLSFSGFIFVLYSPALKTPFIFDDIKNIEQNKNIHISDLSFPSLKKAVTGPRPLAMLSFATGYYLHGNSPVLFRTVNICVHILTALILYLFLKKTIFLLSRQDGLHQYKLLPLVATLLWAVHPLQIQSVTYIVQRMNSLAALFFLLSMLLYIYARLTSSNIRRYFLAFFCILAGISAAASKPNAAMLPVVLLLYELFFFKKRKIKWLFSNYYLAVFLLLLAGAAAWYFMTHLPAKDLSSWYADKNFTPAQRIMTEWRVMIFYLSLIIFPHPSRLNIDHDISLSTSLFSPETTIASLAILIVLVTAAILAEKNSPLFSFGILWFFLNHIIESTVIPLDLIFEHRNYIPSMMFIAAIVSLAIDFMSKNMQMILSIAAACLLSLWTYQRNIVWKSGMDLWQDSVEKSPNKSRSHESLAYYLEKEGRLKEAETQYQAAAQLDSNNAVARYNLGNICMKTERINDAIKYYKSAIEVKPDLKEAYNNIGVALFQLGRIDEAVVYCKKALEIDQNYQDAYINLETMTKK